MTVVTVSLRVSWKVWTILSVSGCGTGIGNPHVALITRIWAPPAQHVGVGCPAHAGATTIELLRVGYASAICSRRAALASGSKREHSGAEWNG